MIISKKPRLSLRKAIDLHCKGCIYDDLTPGTWRKQVENCTISTCPLYLHRPKAKYADKVPNCANPEQGNGK